MTGSSDFETQIADPAKRKGIFISFEGIDGSGKSLQARRLADWLSKNGRNAFLTREPGGSEGGEEIRKLLLNGAQDRWSAETELLLFNAARRDHLERVIRPQLCDGNIVITDRFADSTRAYQGATRGDLRALVNQLHALIIGIEPDITFLIDLPPQLALERARARGDSEQRFENFGIEWQGRVRAGFLDIAKQAPVRVVLLDGTQSPEAIADDVLRIVKSRI